MSNYISMKCKNCGATMQVDPEKHIRYCPYCGSADLIEESDAVKISKMNNETEREKNRYRHIENEHRIHHDAVKDILNNDVMQYLGIMLAMIFLIWLVTTLMLPF